MSTTEGSFDWLPLLAVEFSGEGAQEVVVVPTGVWVFGEGTVSLGTVCEKT